MAIDDAGQPPAPAGGATLRFLAAAVAGVINAVAGGGSFSSFLRSSSLARRH